jgi:type II secretory pathway predicted ATPase ExeA
MQLRAHFDATSTPFTREIPVRRRWRHPQYVEAENGIRQIIEERMSAALIAPAGTGKTLVLRAVRDALPEARYRVHEVKVTGLSKRDFCREIARAVGAKPAGYTGALVRSLQARCRQLLDTESLRPVLFLDEAHDLRPDVLALLRVITNFDLDSKLVVSIILAGQPPLRDMLAQSDLDAVSRRIAFYARLRLLSRQEVVEYLKHRLDAAGASPDVFDSGALDAIYECGQGNLRATDRLAYRAMLLAAENDEKVIGEEIVAKARRQVWP